MTDTTRDLIQRLADALTEWHLGNAPPEDTSDVDLIDEALAYLDQPEPEELTEEEIEKRFQRWWFDEGSGMRPSNGEDQEEHTRRVSQIAWSNGAYVVRWGRPAVEPEPERPTVMEIIALADEVDLVRRAFARWGRNTTKETL